MRYIVVFILFLFICSSCSTEAGRLRRAKKRINRIIKNNPSAIQTDTIIKYDTIYVAGVKDSVTVSRDVSKLESDVYKLIQDSLLTNRVLNTIEDNVHIDTIISRSWGNIKIKNSLNNLSVKVSENDSGIYIKKETIVQAVKPGDSKPRDKLCTTLVAFLAIFLLSIYIVKKII